MKLKHWQGYGTINATRIGKIEKNNDMRTIKIHVFGNHEYGIVTHDKEFVANWLLARFDKETKNTTFRPYRDIQDITTHEYIENGTDVCDYTIRYIMIEKS